MTGKTPLSVTGSTAGGMYTETLARLYLRQGFIREALRIYRQLAQERPQERRLQEQIRTLEQQLASEPPEPHGVSPEGPGSAATRVMPVAEARHTRRVIVELERWLHHLQRQRSAREGEHVEP